MNKKYILRGANGYYFVKGQGFAAYDKSKASQLTDSELTCAAGLGYTGTKTEVVTSFAVCYVRQVDLTSAGTVLPNAKNPSKRRFATRDEANQHGSRFATRKAKGSDVAGSAGHVGFYVIETSDPVNATINWKTGLTNPLV